MTITYTCPRCGAKSHHPADKAEGYCGFCHDYTGPSEENRLPIVVVYHSPTDYPGRYVARRFWVEGGSEPVPEEEPIAVGTHIAEIRVAIPPGMVRMNPLPGDDLKIVETWI